VTIIHFLNAACQDAEFRNAPSRKCGEKGQQASRDVGGQEKGQAPFFGLPRSRRVLSHFPTALDTHFSEPFGQLFSTVYRIFVLPYLARC